MPVDQCFEQVSKKLVPQGYNFQTSEHRKLCSGRQEMMQNRKEVPTTHPHLPLYSNIPRFNIMARSEKNNNIIQRPALLHGKPLAHQTSSNVLAFLMKSCSIWVNSDFLPTECIVIVIGNLDLSVSDVVNT